MQTAQHLKKELEINLELADLLETLKGVAANQYRVLERKKERFDLFLNTFEKFFGMIDFSQVEHPFAKATKGEIAIIMITSDEGFMGGLNTRVINMALCVEGAEYAKLIVIGNHGAGYLRGLGYEFQEFPGVNTDKRYEEAIKLKDFIIKEAMAGSFSSVKLVYPKPLSFTVQKPQVLTILPCSDLFAKREHLVQDGKEVITEGTPKAIIEYLLETWITEKLFEVFEDSNLSEFAARTIHLEDSYQGLQQRSKKIKDQYFRKRHEAVDKGIRDSFASRVIRRKK